MALAADFGRDAVALLEKGFDIGDRHFRLQDMRGRKHEPAVLGLQTFGQSAHYPPHVIRCAERERGLRPNASVKGQMLAEPPADRRRVPALRLDRVQNGVCRSPRCRPDHRFFLPIDPDHVAHA